MQVLKIVSLGLLCAACSAAQEAPARVVTTLPYLADVVRAIGGDEVEVEFLAQPGLDPHFIQPTPGLSVRLAQADALVENGMTLELWSERVIDGARNQQIRPGFPGHVYAATGIRALQVPRMATRAAGDVHLAGNPHVWLDPLNLKHSAKNIEQCLLRVRPRAAEAFAKNRAAFEAKLDEKLYGEELVGLLGAATLNKLQRRGALHGFLRSKQFRGKPLAERVGGWHKRAMPLAGRPLISYHQVWTYFSAGFGIEVAGTIEEKPGIPPSPAHLQQLQELAEAKQVKVVVCAPFYPFSRAEGVAEAIGGTAVLLPTQPGEVEEATDVFAMFDAIFDRLERAAGGGE